MARLILLHLILLDTLGLAVMLFTHIASTVIVISCKVKGRLQFSRGRAKLAGRGNILVKGCGHPQCSFPIFLYKENRAVLQYLKLAKLVY